MPKTVSPLRYPGGKTVLFPLLSSLIDINDFKDHTYVEPYAGGSGLALKLLFENKVSRILINDIDPSIYTFWYCILNKTSQLCDLIKSTPITIEEWNKQKEIWSRRGDGDILSLGFSTLYLNRTNISGILKGGIIGGIHQTGKYKIDARFNKEDIINKIQRIAEYRDMITLYNLDAIDLIYDVLPNIDKTFINFDPPYVKKGSGLYVNFYKSQNHITLGKIINDYDGYWMITYDDCPLIREIYNERRQSLIPICYSAGRTKVAKEIAVFSDNLILANELIENAI